MTDSGLFFATSIVLFSTGHPIGGFVALFFSVVDALFSLYKK